MTAVQMNVRLDRGLKEGGDAVFSAIGYTPTEVVRMLWDFARRNRHDRRAVAEVMQALRDPQEAKRDEAARSERLAAAEEWLDSGQRIIRDYCARFDIDYNSLAPRAHEDYDQLLEEAYDEKYGKWLGIA